MLYISLKKAILQYDKVKIEFFDCKTFGNNAIPQEVFSEAKINEKEYRIDVLWHHLAHIREDGIGDNFRFHLLCNVARLVLITPYYNASIEQVYALVKKNWFKW